MNVKTAAGAATDAVQSEENQAIPAEILAAITAAATAYLGANLRIGSVQLRQPAHEQVSRWTQQGRALVHASHNLRTKR
jgi:hypothetical protein